MRNLPIPTDNAKDVYLNCISNFRNQDLKERLTSFKDEIEKESRNHQLLAEKKELSSFNTGLPDNCPVTTEELKNVYTNKMVPKDSPGRDVYNKLILAPKFGLCPYCGQRTVSTIDHHLPKSHYPVLSVTPTNLVPSCKDCNTTKLEDRPENNNLVIIHPYFDNIYSESWLEAKVIENNPAVIRFYVIKPDDWDETLHKRVINHFSTLELNDLYASQSAVELGNISGSLSTLYVSGGKEAVRTHLKQEAESRRRVLLNSWQTAFYSALYKSDWYCDGGFLQNGL